MRPLKALISKNTIHRAHTDVLVEINNFTYNDAITPGNVVLISDDDNYYHEHHGIVLNREQCYEFFKIKEQQTICTLNEYGTLTRWNTGYLKETFPSLSDDVRIIKVYRKTKYTEDIDTLHDIQNAYKKYNLLTI